MEYVRGDRFGADFTSRRASSLQRFLRRIAMHPVLRRDPILVTFLESGDWNATMRSHTARWSSAAGGAGVGGGDGSSGGGGVFDNLADTVMNAFTKVHQPDQRFVEVRDHANKLDDDLGHVEKVVARVARREHDLEADMRDLAEQFQRLLVLEPGVGPTVRAFAASVEDQAAGLARLREHTDQDYLGSLRDMVAYSGALKSLLKAREQKQLDFEQLTEYLHKTRVDLDALSGGPGGPSSSCSAGAAGGYSSGGSTTTTSLAGAAGGFIRNKIEDVRGVDHAASRRERARRLELRVADLSSAVEGARTTSELFDEEVVREVADFERAKRAEFKAQLGGLADAHAAFYDSVVAVWQRYLREMEAEDAEAAAASAR